MSFSSLCSLRTIGSLATLLCAAVILAPSAHAQANGRVALEAKLQVFTGSGITVTGSAGTPPVTSFIQQGTGLANINYTSSVSTGGIRTSVVLEPTTGNGPGSNRAQTTLLFTPTITLTNNTSSLQLYQIQYDVLFSAFVNATPNGTTTFSSESVSVVVSGTDAGTMSYFSQSLFTDSGLKTDNNGPDSFDGTSSLAPFSSTTFSLRTNISVDNQSRPAAATAVPEPGEWAIMGMMGTSVCGLMVRARRKKA